MYMASREANCASRPWGWIVCRLPGWLPGEAVFWNSNDDATKGARQQS
jgi:hypothetical protein